MGEFQMNIDILVHKYYLKTKALAKNQGIVKNKAYKNRLVLLWVMLISIVFYFLSFYFLRYWLCTLLSIAALILCAFTGDHFSKSDAGIKDWIDYHSPRYNMKIESLVQLLVSYHVTIDENSIDDIIKEAKKNKVKHDKHFIPQRMKKTVFKIFGAILSILTALLKIDFIKDAAKLVAEKLIHQIGALFVDETEIDNINSSLDKFCSWLFSEETVSFCISIIIIVFLCVIACLAMYWIYISELEPRIKRMYFFHDEFIYDLTQLKTFKGHYKFRQDFVSAKERTNNGNART